MSNLSVCLTFELDFIQTYDIDYEKLIIYQTFIADYLNFGLEYFYLYPYIEIYPYRKRVA